MLLISKDTNFVSGRLSPEHLSYFITSFINQFIFLPSRKYSIQLGKFLLY